jgi:hypothetical protein
MECVERFRPEKRMPDVSRENVEKTHRRKNGTGQFLLNGNIPLHDVGVGSDSALDGSVHVLSIKTLIKPGLLERRLGVEDRDAMQRAPGSKRLLR